VVGLAGSVYAGTNHQHLTELLVQPEGIVLSSSTVKRILAQAGLRSPKHRSRRERYPQKGMLLQMDGNPHNWLEGRGPQLTLVAGVDDATGRVPGAVFREEEDAVAYMLARQQVVTTEGTR
jgi:hypothetical protein